KLGAVTSVIADYDLDAGLSRLRDLGLVAVEVACCGYFDQRHADPERLLADPDRLARWTDTFHRFHLEISAFAIHGQPLHPDKSVAEAYSRQFRQICQLSEAIDVRRLTLLAGLPEATQGDSSPNFVIGPFPPETADAYRWQWEDRVLPYWREHARIAEDHG